MQTIAHGPPHDPAGKEVEHHRQIQPPFACPAIGNIDAPFLVGGRRNKILIQQIGRDRVGMVAVGRALETAFLPRFEAVLAHQAGHAPPADGQAVCLHFMRHARAAIGLVRAREGCTHMRQEHHVLSLASAGRAGSPREIATGADTENATQTLGGERFFRLIDEPEPHRPPSLAKKTVARLRMSRSCFRTSFSRRKRLSSAAISPGV